MEITTSCAQFVHGLTFDDIPEDARGWAKVGIADTLAVMLAAADSEVTETMLRSRVISGYGADRYVEDGAAAPNERVIPLDGFAPAKEAALAMGTIGHALDFDDVGGFGHSSTVLVPTVFALAARCRPTGADAITAYTAGFEVGTRLGDRNLFGRIDHRSHRRGQHPTSVFGTIAAAATAAWLLKLSEEQTAMALGIAASESCGLLRNFGTMTKPMHAGFAARSGVMAAELAAVGFTADPDALDGFLRALNPPLGDDPERQQVLMESLGREWKLSDGVAVKHHPACWTSHRAVAGLVDMLGGRPLPIDEVAALEVDLRTTPLLRTDPKTGLEGKFSMAFNLAATAVRGGLPIIDDYSAERLANPDIRRALSLVEDHKDSSDDGVRIAIRRKDGTVEERYVTRALGDPTAGLDMEFVAEKFNACAVRAVGQETAARLATQFFALEDLADLSQALELAVAGQETEHVTA